MAQTTISLSRPLVCPRHRGYRSSSCPLPVPSSSTPWRSNAGPLRGTGLLPLRRVVPWRLPPGVASGRRPQQRDQDVGNMEQQSSPHDWQQRSWTLLGLFPHRGGGYRPCPSSWKRSDSPTAGKGLGTTRRGLVFRRLPLVDSNRLCYPYL